MNILTYVLVFLASLLVDIVPFIGPPAWMVMVFFQMRFGLNIWMVLAVGVTGSAIGRYLYSAYIHLLSKHFIKPQKNDDWQFIGRKLAQNGWRVHLFVLLYTLIPVPSTPLFTAAGCARIKTVYIIPAFFVGKFTSDALMVFAGNYAVHNIDSIVNGLLSWKTIAGTILGLLIICIFLFTNWQKLLRDKKFTLSVNIWK